jgi:hypothetical protein
MHCSPACLLVSFAAAAALVAQGSAAPTAPAPAPSPPALAGSDQKRPADAKLPGLEAEYEEEKHLALLALPLKSKGRMLFLPPGYLARLVEAPEKSQLLITPEQIRIDGRDGREIVDLKRSDRVRVFVTALVQVFAGNEPVLRKSFTVDYAVDPKSTAAWTLTLTPKEKSLEQMLTRLTMQGEGLAVARIEVVDPNGDRTVTRVVKADPKRTFDAAEKQRWFGIEPR